MSTSNAVRWSGRDEPSSGRDPGRYADLRARAGRNLPGDSVCNLYVLLFGGVLGLLSCIVRRRSPWPRWYPGGCAYYGTSDPLVHTPPFRGAVRNDDLGGARPAGVRSGASIFEPRGARDGISAALRVALGGTSAPASRRGGSVPVNEDAGARGYALVKVK